MSIGCTYWVEIERASDGEADRVTAALHVRSCDACRRRLRAHGRLRRSFQSTFPLVPLDAALSATIQAGLMLQRNLTLQTWLRRSTAVAAAVLLFCTLSATFARSDAGSDAGSDGAQGSDESVFVAPIIDRDTDTPQQVTQWIVQDLSRGR